MLFAVLGLFTTPVASADHHEDNTISACNNESFSGFTPGNLSGKIIDVTEGVLIQAQGSIGWTKATIGNTIFPGDAVKTPVDGNVKIEFLDGQGQTIVNLGSGTEACMGHSSLEDKLERGWLDLQRGAVYFTSFGWDDTAVFFVKTGSTISGIRGSEVVFLYAPEAKLFEMYVKEGLVEVNNYDTNVKNFVEEEQVIEDKGGRVEIDSITRNKWQGAISAGGFESKIEATIPEWIRNNAKWWSEGLIGDADFASGLQFLITQEIMKIPPTSQVADAGTDEIPEWIKNNAGWWADGLIDDETFVQGVQYLVEQGIIRV